MVRPVIIHLVLDLIHRDGYVPFPAREVSNGTLVPCTDTCFAVFENGGGDRKIPLDTTGYQTFTTEWGIGRVRTMEGKALIQTLSQAEVRKEGSSKSRDLNLEVMVVKMTNPLPMESSHQSVRENQGPPPPTTRDPEVRKKLSGEYDNPLIVTFNESPATTCTVDDNDNEVKDSPAVDDESGKSTRRTVLPGGHVYYEEDDPLAVDTDEESDDSELSDTWSDDDGHGECGRGGFHTCDDNPDNYHMRNDEDENINVVDISDMDQNLPQEEDSGTRPSGFMTRIDENRESDESREE